MTSREYYGHFAVKKISPKFVLKEFDEYEMIDAATFNMTLSHDEAKKLEEILGTINYDKPGSVTIKIELRNEKKKSDGSYSATVTSP